MNLVSFTGEATPVARKVKPLAINGLFSVAYAEFVSYLLLNIHNSLIYKQ